MEVETPKNQPAPEVGVDLPKEKIEKAQKAQKAEEQFDVRVNDSFTCYIAGKQYDFEKGKIKKVPKSVKEILLEAGKLEAV